MKSLVKARSEKGLWLQDTPKPEIGANDVLIRIKKTAICGTDLHIFNWDAWAQKTIPVPMVVGHEYVGTIEAIGSDVRGVKIGQRVSGEGHIVCGHCRNCRAGRAHLCRNTLGVGVNRPGAFGEFLSLPASNIYPIPDDIPDEIASILDPLGNAVHTALSFDLIGEDVLITGAGPIGLMAVAVCRHVGARNIVITDLNDYRLSLAQKMGATRAVRADQHTLREVMDSVGMTEGFDVGLEMSGSPVALRNMIGAMNNGGKVALLGILSKEAAIDWNEVIFKGLILKGIYGREMYETWYKMIAMLQGGLDVTPVITHRIGFSQFETGFDALNSGTACKVVMDMAG
ncbi:L-threonine 3-dehydrogenase [Methylovirgula sp. 4M-Z18]|uniref:L-threonine 3-dehydrogenase n=1 Tax=Methylovirgula sp. 4M-Z18 TaxID=2293567 RepID=UPI000E2FF02F|nr:L-threonine 3-dehydrogenase [Methylovirgula sp. 4M-Z18]RFB78981.1 L-threonine 3-dehydrogenase [Methylovirgula sp. 4M-Z18]